MKQTNITIGENIKRIRKEKGLTQKQLAEMLGVTQQMIGTYENNKRTPKLDTALKIAKALDVDVLDLLGLNVNIDKTFTGKEFKNVEKMMDYQYFKILLGNGLTDAELNEVIQFIEFLKSKRK